MIKIDFKKDKTYKEPVIFKTAECWIADAFLSWTGLAGEVSRKRDLIYVCKFSSMHQMIDDGNMSNVTMIDPQSKFAFIPEVDWNPLTHLDVISSQVKKYKSLLVVL